MEDVHVISANRLPRAEMNTELEGRETSECPISALCFGMGMWYLSLVRRKKENSLLGSRREDGRF
jgi:hypothetical protein